MKERTALEKQYEKRMRRFEADVKKFQEKAPYMSQQLGAQEQNRILGEEKSLLQMQEDMGAAAGRIGNGKEYRNT